MHPLYTDVSGVNPFDHQYNTSINDFSRQYTCVAHLLTYYKFEMISIIVSALGYVPKELTTNLEKLNFNEKEVKSISRKLQTITVSGTVKIMKTL